MNKSTSEKKEAVRQFIAHAVPSVMDLQFGCEIKFYGIQQKLIYYNRNNWHLVTDKGEADFDSIEFRKKVEIIGRPITLADVLVAIAHSIEAPREITGFQVGERFKEYDSKLWQTVCKWDWEKDDFDHQSEAFYLFAWELLK